MITLADSHPTVPQQPGGVSAVPTPVRVLVLHGQAVFAEVLSQRLGRQPDVEVVGAVVRPARALALVASSRVSVVVLDWALPLGALDVLEQLRELPCAPVVIALGEGSDPSTIVEALAAGVLAWVPVHGSVDTLLEALQSVQRGDTWLPGRALGPVLHHLLRSNGAAPPSVLDALTDRELDVLRCMVAGLDQTAIAARLYLSPNTVRTHRRRTLAKLGVHSSLEAVFVARRAGLTPDTGR